jgi:hypothetical protein
MIVVVSRGKSVKVSTVRVLTDGAREDSLNRKRVKGDHL